VPDLNEAFRMLDVFASCGAQSFVVTKTELEWPGHKKLIWGKTYPIETLREKLPAIVRTSAMRHPMKLPDESEIMTGENVIIRPTGSGVAFVQLDDLKTQEQIDRVRPAAFIIHETRAGNRQAWIAVSGVPEGKEEFKEFTRRVRRAVGANDKSASHATRLAGTENWKTKYLPNPPTVTILEANLTPHVAQNLGRRGGSAIDGRTTHHLGYRLSQKKRKRIEECFGWLKTIALMRKLRHRGVCKVDWIFAFACAAYNLMRMRNLATVPAT
jgi:hypothetical protein